MDSLGPCRENREQQQQYLLNLATRFQSMTLHALAARYGTDSLFDKNADLKLATAVVNRNEVFADDLWERGHTMTFGSGSEDSEGSTDDESEDAEDSDEESFSVRQKESEPDLDGILHDACTAPKPKPDGIIPWLEVIYTNSRGFELGTFDSSLLPVIWKKQSANWDDLALGYVSDVVTVVHKFIMALISGICEDQRVQSALMSVLMDGLIDRYTKSINHTKFIISVEKNGTPLTTNHYFSENLEKW